MASDYAIRALIDKLEPEMAEAFLQAIEDVNSAAQRTAIEQAIRRGLSTGNMDRAIREVTTALSLGRAFFAPLDMALQSAFLAGGVYQASLAPKRSGPAMPYVAVRFDGRHDRAEKWTRNQAATMIKRVGDDARESVRLVLTSGFQENRTYTRIARDIVGMGKIVDGVKRSGGIIGLHPKQTAAVLRARLELENGDYASYLRRAKAMRNGTFSNTIKKAMADGKTLPQAYIDKVVADYAERLLDHRGKVIARTESNKALNAGRVEGINQMIDSGKLRVEAVTKTWSATLGKFTRDSHMAMNGMTVGWREYFMSPLTFAILKHPHDEDAPASETVNCRCILTIRIDWAMMARFERQAA